MRDFEFLRPRSLSEACQMMADHGEEARLFAGGTALLLAMRQRLLQPTHVVHIGGLTGLKGIEYDEVDGLRIGALARHAEIANNQAIVARYPVLADMAAHVANPQVRNMGTIGGNLCYGDPSTDPPTCLMALDAKVLLRGVNGERTLDLEEFFIDYFQTALEPEEIVVEIRVPPLPDGANGAYTRFVRTAAEHRPLVGVAVLGRREGESYGDVRITIGASVPIPSRARDAEQFLLGKRVSREILEEGARIAAENITPLSDSRGSEDYRRAMVEIVVRRTLGRVYGLDLN